MAVLNRDEFFNAIQTRVGNDTSDDAINFIENMTDTFNSLENGANGDGVDWKQKYEELDESWKKKYAHRFFSGGSNSVPPQENNNQVENDEPDTSYESLFKVKGEK